MPPRHYCSCGLELHTSGQGPLIFVASSEDYTRYWQAIDYNTGQTPILEHDVISSSGKRTKGNCTGQQQRVNDSPLTPTGEYIQYTCETLTQERDALIDQIQDTNRMITNITAERDRNIKRVDTLNKHIQTALSLLKDTTTNG